MVRSLRGSRRGPDEEVLVRTRRHARVLAGPVLVGFVAVVGAAAALGVMPDRWQPWGTRAVLIAAAVVVVVWTLLPWLRWATTTLTVTNRRVMTRSGIVVRRGRDVRIDSLVDVSWQAGPLDRLMGCGTLTLTTAVEEPLVLHDVPGARHVVDLFSDLDRHDEEEFEDLDDEFEEYGEVTGP